MAFSKIVKNGISLLILAIIATLAAGCGNAKSGLDDNKVNVVTTFYPLYDFARQIGGEHVNVINLVPAGVEPHEWTPQSRDVANASGAQLLLYNGAGFEGWFDNFAGNLKKKSGLIIVEASKGIKLLHGDGKREAGDDHGHQASDIDPHTWLSPLSAIQMADNIKNGLIEADPANKADYEAGFAKLSGELQALDSRYKEQLGRTSAKSIVVSHQAFSYLCRDYGLEQVPIMGLSPDAEPTAKDLQNISVFVKENNVKYIFFEELVSDKLAKTLANDLHIGTMVLNPLEGLTDEQLSAGENYISIMDKNLHNLMSALQ